ncbi:transporter substrate-binding domain-containing protein [Vibrio harveyi]|uniref:ATP-binding protein n=1 Tax=Vibrio harveyi TaxID=669 RepID=UPI001EFCD48E|nr:transporter substrate-binding domain-containing protein [Vibrio harveyi]MCG9547283.1 transporter substrate-binding domain-containing protein [Vibrio harveyi]
MFSILRKTVILFVAFIGTISPSYSFASDESSETVLVGVIALRSEDPEIGNKIGTYYGINLDYLTNIAKVLNLELELRSYNTIPELFADIENGTIDGAVGFSKSPDRESRFIFSDAFFSSTIAVWYREDSYYQRDPRELQWVCVIGTVYCEYLEDMGATKVRTVESRLKAFEEVRGGRANALISSYVAINQYLDENDIVNGAVDIPSWLNEEESRFIASKSNQALVDRINKILSWERNGKNIRSVASTNPYHVNDKLLVEYRRDLENKQIITYSSSEEAFPFLFRNPHTDELDGFLPDFIDLIQSRTGLKFEYQKPSSSLNSGLTAFNADLVPVAYVENPPLSDWLVTKPFMHNNFVAIEALDPKEHPAHDARSGILMSLKKQGLVNLDSWKEERFTRYEDLRQLLTDLKQGKIEVAYIPDDIVHSMIAQDNIDGLLISEKDTLTLSIAFAVADHNTKLKKILDSIIDTIDAKEIEKLNRTYRNFNLVYGYDEEHIFTMILIVVVVFVILLAVAYFVLAHLKLKVNLAELNATNEEKEKQWLMEIIQEINSIVFIHGEDNQIQMSNCSLYKNHRCKGCTIQSRKSAKPLVDNVIELRQVIAGKRIADITASNGCKLGIQHVYRERKAILSPSSKKKFVLTVLQDITEQKEREFALIDAQEKAQTAVRSRENFLATMSHELRTPLSAAHGLLDLLDRQTSSEGSKELITQAMRSLNHLNLLVDEVLDYSKLEAGQLKVTPVKTHAVNTLCDVIRSFEPKASSKGLEYRVTFKPFLNPWLKVDAVRLVQIATNLLSNAVKFTNEGEISVSIAVHEGRLILKIADTGIGMTETQLEGILQPFVQADDTITRKYGGTGLGLSIVDRLVDCMGGELCINSQFGLGTTMVVKLPITFCEPEPQAALSYTFSPMLPANVRDWCLAWGMASTDVKPNLVGQFSPQGKYQGLNLDCGSKGSCELTPSEAKYPDTLLALLRQDCTLKPTAETEDTNSNLDWKHGTVLVAEDNPINQSVITMQLRELGIEPVIVSNGLEAWQYVNRDHQVALVLTDFHMPEMDGFELVKKLKAAPELASIPVIGVTAEDSRLANERAKHIGIDDILYKPYDLEKLRSKLLPFLGQEKMAQWPEWIEKFRKQDAKEIANVFKRSMTHDVANLKAATSKQDKKRIIHGIKGALGAIGVTILAELCIEAEKASDGEFEAHVTDLIERIEQEINLAEHWIKAHE